MKRLSVVVTVIGLLALPGCGSGAQAKAASLVPSNAVFYAGGSISPSASQKSNLYGFIKNFPDENNDVGKSFDDTREKALREAFKDSGDYNYKKDIEPWLGNAVAVAVLPAASSAGEPRAVVFVETKDKSKSTTFVAKANKQDDTTTYQAVGDYVVGVDTSSKDAKSAKVFSTLEALEKDSKGSLAESKKYQDAIGGLHGDNLAVGYADGQAISEIVVAASAAADASALNDDPGTDQAQRITEGLAASKKNYDCLSGVLGANKKGATFGFATYAGNNDNIVVEGKTNKVAPYKTVEPEILNGLPADSSFALDIVDLGGHLKTSLACLDDDSTVKGYESQFGFDLNADVLSWTHGETVLVSGNADGKNGATDLAIVAKVTNKATAEAALSKLATYAGDQLGGQLERTTVGGADVYEVPGELSPGIQPLFGIAGDRFILATNETYFKALSKAAAKPLSKTAEFKASVAEGNNKTGFLVFGNAQNTSQFFKSIEAGLAGGDVEDSANKGGVTTFGARSWIDGDNTRFELRAKSATTAKS